MESHIKSGVDDASHKRQARRYEVYKTIFLAIVFFCIIGSYTIAKELKNSLFVAVVGKEFIPWVRFLAMIVLIPAILVYSKLVDRLRRYWLLSAYATFFGFLGIIFTYMIGHPEIGMGNTDTSPYRVFGWLFYFFVEGFSPFVVSVFWAFANSVNSPESAKRDYGWMVAASKFGGVATAGLAWLMLGWVNSAGQQLYSDVLNHQLLLLFSSLLLLVVPILLIIMMRVVPGRYLHGYEAAYQAQKEKKKQGKEKTGMFVGLKMLIKYPYVMGIFGMAFFYEVTATVLSYVSIGVAQSHSSTSTQVLRYLLQVIFYTHLIGLAVSLVGTNVLFNKLGTRRCLLLVPAIAGITLFYLMYNFDSPDALIVALSILRGVNYAFSWPLRESLYIPTVKEIKFKSKSWVDAFGSKLAKTSGSSVNVLGEWLGAGFFFSLYSVFFTALVGLWFIVAILLGKRFDYAVKNNEVIGLNDDE